MTATNRFHVKHVYSSFCVQLLQVYEVGELRWDRANELIRVEAPETATMKGHMKTQCDVD